MVSLRQGSGPARPMQRSGEAKNAGQASLQSGPARVWPALGPLGPQSQETWRACDQAQVRANWKAGENTTYIL